MLNILAGNLHYLVCIVTLQNNDRPANTVVSASPYNAVALIAKLTLIFLVLCSVMQVFLRGETPGGF